MFSKNGVLFMKFIKELYFNKEITEKLFLKIKAMRIKDEAYFKKYMRMSPSEFNKLKEFVAPYIKKFPIGRKALSVGHRLAITLR